jgi:hypothetical protein
MPRHKEGDSTSSLFAKKSALPWHLITSQGRSSLLCFIDFPLLRCEKALLFKHGTFAQDIDQR